MHSIRKLPEHDIENYAKIAVVAFSGLGLSDEVLKKRIDFMRFVFQNETNQAYFGCYDQNDVLIGGMRAIDYPMNLFGTKTIMGGIGSVVVDLLRKKESAARELLAHAHNYFNDRGVAILGLYPFRIDFYKKMGFGYGTYYRQFRIKPGEFPGNTTKEHLTYLGHEDKEAIRECYHRFASRHHGMLDRIESDYKRTFQQDNRFIGYRENGNLLGYMKASFEYTELKSQMHVDELVYDSPDVFREFCSFLHSQLDQFDRIHVNTYDENFHFLVSNPDNGIPIAFDTQYKEIETRAVGMLYKIINARRFFEIMKDHNFNNQTCRLKISLRDSFFAPNNGSFTVGFEQGKATVSMGGKEDVEISMDISNFSSLALGTIDFNTLLTFSLARISKPEYASVVRKIFHSDKKPVCTTYF